MVVLREGDILTSSADAIVNPVNCVGVMGRGLALQFKNAFPENFRAYKHQSDLREDPAVADRRRRKLLLNPPTNREVEGLKEPSCSLQRKGLWLIVKSLRPPVVVWTAGLL